jgi:hypothetical protein
VRRHVAGTRLDPAKNGCDPPFFVQFKVVLAALEQSPMFDEEERGEEADDLSTRSARLTEVIDWAQAEAAELGAPDAGICLQLARLALQSRAGS